MEQATAFTTQQAGDAAKRSGRPGEPRNHLVEIVRATWAAVLGVDVVGPDDSFFDLGGNSFSAAAALATLGDRLGLDLPLRAVFEAPTPREMADLAAQQRLEQNTALSNGITPFFPPWVVQLQREGPERPVFLFPGGLGGKWILHRDAQVAALVGRRHPFYGFRRDEFHLDRDGPGWFARTAADYVAQMRSIQGRGPYLIYGVCSGGALAWETARRLVAAGERMPAMLFYEAPFQAELTTIVPGSSPSQPGRPVRLSPYAPMPLPVDLTLLMTEGWQARGRSAGWETVVGGTLETVIMPGDTPGAHNLYMNREKMIARHLRRWLESSEARLHGR